MIDVYVLMVLFDSYNFILYCCAYMDTEPIITIILLRAAVNDIVQSVHDTATECYCFPCSTVILPTTPRQLFISQYITTTLGYTHMEVPKM